MNNVKSLIATSKTFYPSSKHMQRQWVKKTMYLESTGKHCKLTGGWAISKIKGDANAN